MRRSNDGSSDSTVRNVLQREVGGLAPRNFARSLTASKDLILRFQIVRRLQQHCGCVNALNFNLGGDVLLSSSDDKNAILWDWQTGNVKLSFHTGHTNNVFQAKFMPFTNDHTIVTSAADGQVRHAQILEGGVVQTTLLTEHQGRVHKLAIEPGSPHIFYTCGEDGVVQHLDLRSRGARELFTCRSADGGRGGLMVHLNAIAIDPRNPNLFAVAGSDEYARLYDMRRYRWDSSSDFSQPINYFCPPDLVGSASALVAITGLAFSNQSELLVSYYSESIYLFDPKMGLGPQPCANGNTEAVLGMTSDETVDVPQEYTGHSNFETVKGVGFFGPKCEYVVSGSDCGRVFIWKRNGKLIRVMEADNHVVNCVEPHPHMAVLATSGIEKDIKVWTPSASERASSSLPPKSVHTRFDLDSDDDESFGDDEEEDDNGDSSSDYSFDDEDDDDGDDDASADGDMDLDDVHDDTGSKRLGS